MKSSHFLRTILILFIVICAAPFASAQNNGSVAQNKFEVASEFTTITFDVGETKIGLGGRLTYNLNSHVALETATYIFAGGCDFCGRHAGHMAEMVGGVKIGKRWNKWGLFGKARPGILTSSQGNFDIRLIGIQRTDPSTFFIPNYEFAPKRLTTFVADVGGVAEFYPTDRIILRADFGSTIIHYGPRTVNFPLVNPFTGDVTTQRSTNPAQNRGALQFTVGVGFRF